MPFSITQYLGRYVVRIQRRISPRLVQQTQERLGLRRIRRLGCDATHLGPADRLDLRVCWASSAGDWPAVGARIHPLLPQDQISLGVNPGDRRAIYHLVRHLRPHRVLEVGTHVGASTVHIAAALDHLRRDNPGTPWHLTTVDIRDVNDPVQRPWREYGATHSPRELLAGLGWADLATFVAQPSLTYLAATHNQFDFIFLDGDHGAVTVYQEIPAALRHLAPGGYLLLHDYFPGLRPLWGDAEPLPGPYLGVRRLQKEGAPLVVRPLAELPWETKLGSRVTSLALLGRK